MINHFEEQLREEMYFSNELKNTEDYRKVSVLLGKRKPLFKGK